MHGCDMNLAPEPATSISQLEWRKRLDTDSNNQVLKAKYSGKHFDLLSITSRSDYRTEILNDADFGPFNFGNQDFTFDSVSYNQELRLSSPNDGESVGMVGRAFSVPRTRRFAKSHTPAYFAVRDTDIDIGTVAVFGQATYTLFDSLHLTVGTRYEHQNLEGKQTNQFAATPKYSHSETNDESAKLSIAYDLTDDIMAYGTYSKGFLSGGYNFHMGNNADDMYFKPEHTTQL